MTKCLVGTIILVLSIVLVCAPIPLSNVEPALVIAFISLAYLEEDGLLLSIALLAVWETFLGAKWLGHLW